MSTARARASGRRTRTPTSATAKFAEAALKRRQGKGQLAPARVGATRATAARADEPAARRRRHGRRIGRGIGTGGVSRGADAAAHGDGRRDAGGGRRDPNALIANLTGLLHAGGAAPPQQQYQQQLQQQQQQLGRAAVRAIPAARAARRIARSSPPPPRHHPRAPPDARPPRTQASADGRPNPHRGRLYFEGVGPSIGDDQLRAAFGHFGELSCRDSTIRSRARRCRWVA